MWIMLLWIIFLVNSAKVNNNLIVWRILRLPSLIPHLLYSPSITYYNDYTKIMFSVYGIQCHYSNFPDDASYEQVNKY